MKGLIIKDLLFLKGNIKTFFVIIVAFIFMSFTMKGMDFSFYLPFLAIMMCISTFSYDEYNKWDIYMSSLPISRKKIVKAKYGFSLLSVVVAFILSFAISTLISMIQNAFTVESLLSSIVYGFLAISFVLSLMYPLVYKFGVEKSRIAVFIAVVIISLVIGFASVGVEKLDIPSSIASFITFLTDYHYIFVTLLSFLILYISYLISCKIYSKKEL